MTGPPLDGSAGCVFVVGDDMVGRTATAEAVAAAGFHVVQAYSSAAALRMLMDGAAPAVLVTDVRMPGLIDGFALANIVVRRWPSVAVLVYSADVRPRPGDMPAGAQFLETPDDLAALARLVSALATPSAEVPPS